ncbi:GH12 family glycosyl hydrolase domain-containing protein [Niveibacterium terrae]|uniref:GH12 family glycosyl hydrolase domain-containing protein n=1 Tax=Niveibacterium terrae TaxID=3373598 RepID=UPI003A939D1F
MLHRSILLPVLLSAILCASCGGGGSEEASIPTTNPGDGVHFNPSYGTNAAFVPIGNDSSEAEFCADQGKSRWNDYLLENNTWNKGTVTGYTSCMTMKAGVAPGVSPSWRWSWPLSGGDAVRDYPEVIFGQKPWYASSTTGALPRVVNTLASVTARFGAQLEHSSDGGGNFAFDIWLTTSKSIAPGGSYLPLHTELMILLDNWGSYQPAGSKIAEVTIDGVVWELYHATAGWGPSPWSYVNYLPKTRLTSPYQVNIHHFLADLSARGLITGKEWLASVELGTEILAGSGSASLQNYSVQVELN